MFQWWGRRGGERMVFPRKKKKKKYPPIPTDENRYLRGAPAHRCATRNNSVIVICAARHRRTDARWQLDFNARARDVLSYKTPLSLTVARAARAAAATGRIALRRRHGPFSGRKRGSGAEKKKKAKKDGPVHAVMART